MVKACEAFFKLLGNSIPRIAFTSDLSLDARPWSQTLSHRLPPPLAAGTAGRIGSERWDRAAPGNRSACRCMEKRGDQAKPVLTLRPTARSETKRKLRQCSGPTAPRPPRPRDRLLRQ